MTKEEIKKHIITLCYEQFPKCYLKYCDFDKIHSIDDSFEECTAIIPLKKPLFVILGNKNEIKEFYLTPRLYVWRHRELQ